MKNLWSGFGGIKERAGEAFNVAKKSLKDIALEPSDDDSSKNNEIDKLKSECNLLQEQLYEKSLEINEYLNTISSLKNINGTKPEFKSFDERLLDFKIFIGLEDSAKALEMKEKAEKNLEFVSAELVKEKNRGEGLVYQVATAENVKNELLSQIKEKTEAINTLEATISKNEAIYDEQKEKISSLQTSLLQYKKKCQANIEACYSHLKTSCGAIGISIPQIKPENLGLEDIQEFLYTQTQFILENVNKIYLSLSGKSNIKHIKSLEGVSDAVFLVTDEASKKISEYKEISNTAENMFQQSKKENLEILKKLNDLSKNFEDCKKTLGKREEEIVRLKEFTKAFDEVKTENEKLTQLLKKNSDAYGVLEKEFENEKIKFEKTYTYVSTLEEEHAELKQKIKVLTVNLQEKEKILQALNDEKNDVLEKYSENSRKMSNQLTELKNFYENKLLENSENYKSEKKQSDETYSQQISDLQNLLSKAINEAKDINIAKLQVNKYQQGVERLQELVKSLENQLSSSLSKIDCLIQENEGLNTKILKKTKKNHKLKVFNLETSKNLAEKTENSAKEKLEIEAKLKESEDMKKQAEILLEKVQNKIQADDNLIDRRLVTTFLINYLNEENTEKMKLQMLKPLAEMLGMTREQRLKIGLEQDQGLLAQFATFLMRS